VWQIGFDGDAARCRRALCREEPSVDREDEKFLPENQKCDIVLGGRAS
jgi:hypothetical protein